MFHRGREPTRVSAGVKERKCSKERARARERHTQKEKPERESESKRETHTERENVFKREQERDTHRKRNLGSATTLILEVEDAEDDADPPAARRDAEPAKMHMRRCSKR